MNHLHSLVPSVGGTGPRGFTVRDSAARLAPSATLLRNWAGTRLLRSSDAVAIGPVEKPLINVCQADTQFDVVIRTAALNGERSAWKCRDGRDSVCTRFRVAKPASIEDGGFKIACIIRDLSLTGAAVEVTDLDTKTIPATFTLIVPEDKLKLSCRVVWRTAFRIGLTFT
jgi:hypothetical protein